MKKSFTNIINQTIRASEGIGVADLQRLNQAIGYWAPEMKESWFWYGHGSVVGYLDILNNNFQDNRAVRDIYTRFLHENYKPKLMEV